MNKVTKWFSKRVCRKNKAEKESKVFLKELQRSLDYLQDFGKVGYKIRID